MKFFSKVINKMRHEAKKLFLHHIFLFFIEGKENIDSEAEISKEIITEARCTILHEREFEDSSRIRNNENGNGNFSSTRNINPFYVTGLFLNPLKTSETLWFSDFFRGCRKRPVARNGLMRARQFLVSGWFVCTRNSRSEGSKAILVLAKKIVFFILSSLVELEFDLISKRSHR